MKVWQLNQVTDLSINFTPLTLTDLPVPIPLGNKILIRVSCCGVCHTELDEIEGRVIAPSYPIIPGHQGVDRDEKLGPDAAQFTIGDRFGGSWIRWGFRQCYR